MFEPNCVIVTIAPETSLKTFFVRRFIEKKLRENIRDLLKANGVEFHGISGLGARFLIGSSKPEKVAAALKKCFGIHAISIAQRTNFTSVEVLSEKGVEISKEIISKGTFAVRAKSHLKEISSKEIDCLMGEKILFANKKLKVNLSKPDNTVHCIVWGEEAFFYFDSDAGAGGFPVGSQGAIALILSGKAKKDLALGWLLMRSGCKVLPVTEKKFSKTFGKLREWNSLNNFKEISVEEAKKRFEEGRILAFFSSETAANRIEKINFSIGEKVFAPFILNSSKTYFS
ncbi:MAG: THUMP domain-containing protein [archaeon]